MEEKWNGKRMKLKVTCRSYKRGRFQFNAKKTSCRQEDKKKGHFVKWCSPLSQRNPSGDGQPSTTDAEKRLLGQKTGRQTELKGPFQTQLW